MVGLNLPEARRAAHAFGENFFELAVQRSSSIGTIKIGSQKCHLFAPHTGGQWEDLFEVFQFISAGNATDLNCPAVHVLSRDELPVAPSIEWAREWIDAHSVIPEVISYPYKIFFDKNTGLFYLFDTRSQTGVVYIRRPSETDLRGMITPFRLMWSWIANSSNASIVHASAVSTELGTVLLAGASGSGKSTMAVNLALAGNHLISDDCTWIQDGICYPVFDRAKIKKNSELSQEIVDRGVRLKGFETEIDSKAFFQVSQFNRRETIPSEVAHIFFPVIWPGLSDLKLSHRSAFERLELDSGREVFQNGARSKVFIAQICKEIPASILWVSPNWTDNIERVYAILERDIHVKS